MSTKPKNTATSKSKAAGAPKPTKSEPAKVDRRAYKTVVKSLRQNLQQKLEKNIRASLSDYIRLVQLEKELQTTEAKETKATWVDPKNGESDIGK
jgi:hypothetical protein